MAISGMALPPIINFGSDYLKDLVVDDVIKGKKISVWQFLNLGQEVMWQG